MEDYANKRILITGGFGFIGSNLARSLVSQGAKVTLIDNLNEQFGGNLFNISDIREKLNFNICDIRDHIKMEKFLKNQDYLFSLAGQTSHIASMRDPKTDLEINTSAQLSILEICRKVNPDIKIVFASTRQLYGKPEYLPVDEKHPVRPVDINGIHKLSSEWYHYVYNNVYGLRTCSLRLTNTYGPGMRVKDSLQTFLGIWIRHLVEEIPIQIFGDGLQLRDFNYVDDCVKAFLKAGISEKVNGKVFNLGSKEVISLLDLAKKMLGLGIKGSYELIPFPDDRKAIDIGDYYTDFSKISSELDWYPKICLEQGLKETIEYYNSNSIHYWKI